jgi:hypothetical protein
MSGFDLTKAQRQRRCRPPFRAKCVDQKSGSDDIHDRIDGAHFVESNVCNRDPMDASFSLSQKTENADRVSLGRLGEVRLLNQLLDIRPMPMVVVVRIVRIMGMLVVMTGGSVFAFYDESGSGQDSVIDGVDSASDELRQPQTIDRF